MFENGQLAAARFHEPLIIGVGHNDFFLSSDVLGFIEFTDDAIYLENGNFVILDKNKFQILDFQGEHAKYGITKASKEFGDVYKWDYAHFTLKEIYEQSETVLKAGEKSKEAIEKTAELIRDAKHIYVTGSGTSYNSALIAKQILSKYVKIKAEPVISSELQFAPDSIEENSIIVVISQSGESVDVLDAVKIAKQKNCKIIGIVNLMTSSLAREADIVIGMNCGSEIGVAATKSFTSQLIILYKIVQKLSNNSITINFENFSQSILKILEDTTKI